MRKFLLGLVVLAGLSSLSASDDVHGPVVVATESVTGSFSSVSPVTVFTPTVDSGYIVTLHLSINGNESSGNSSASAEVHYTNTLGQDSANRVFDSVNSGHVADAIAFIYAKAGTPVIFFTTYTAGNDGATYDIVYTFIKQ